MRNIKNINEDYTKTKAKIAELTDRLKKLEQEKTDAENAEIITAVRGGKMTEREVSALLKRFRQDGQTPIKSEKEDNTQ